MQVSRLGNPLVNEVVIPLGKKDFFNATQPADDGANFGKYVVKPELAKVINILFPGLNVPETDRTDIVTALLTGVPGLTQIRPSAPPTDTLKINLGVAPNPSPNRFGVLAGDTQGFPNGRRLTDDVVDIELRVVGGFLKGNKLPLGDGVDQNDEPFRSTFPYVAAPHNGFDSAAQAQRADARPDAGPAVVRARERLVGGRGSSPPAGRAATSTSTAPAIETRHAPLSQDLPPRPARGARRLRADRRRPARDARREPAPAAAPRSARAALAAAAGRVDRRADRRAPGDRPRAPARRRRATRLLAAAYLQKVRETGDAGFYAARRGR